MSSIYVKFSAASKITGESTTVGFADQVVCAAMRHSIYLPVIRAASRVQSGSEHGPVALIHTIDKSSPLLKKAAMMGSDLGEVVISRTRIIEGEIKAIETITLNKVKVVRVDVDTPVSSSTLEPSEELLETVYLDYRNIKWSAHRSVGGVASTVETEWKRPTA